MTYEDAVPWLIFTATFCFISAVAFALSSRRRNPDQRMDDLKQQLAAVNVNRSAERQQLIEKATITLSATLRPRSEAELAGLKKELAAAGYPGPAAVPIYATIRLIALVACAILASLISLSVHLPPLYERMLIPFGLFVGLFGPKWVLGMVVRRRQKRIFKSLPEALDLLIISIEVGQGIDAAFRNVNERLASHAKELCAEFQLFLNHLFMGMPRRDALHQLGARSGVTELNSLAAVLIQADRFGSSIVESLRGLSDTMRIRRRQMAEEKAQKTAVKLVVPLLLFIFPGIFVVLVGPAGITLYRDFVSGGM